MQPLSDALLTELEDEARAWVSELRALRTYQGKDQRYYQKVKIAVGIISGLARMRASESNRMAIELAAGRAIGSLPPKEG